jgi:hypothetical protein
MKEFEKYKHHSGEVWVRSNLKGKHKEHCLCFSCEKFKPNTPENCTIADENFELCKKHNLVLPVWECHTFKNKK